jgi:hypothetical protein
MIIGTEGAVPRWNASAGIQPPPLWPPSPASDLHIEGILIK